MRFFILFLTLVSFLSVAHAGEQIGNVVYDYYSYSKPYPLAESFKNVDGKKRTLIAIEAFVLPKKNGNTGTFKVSLVYEDGKLDQSLPNYKPEKLENIKAVRFDVKNISTDKIRGARLAFDQEMIFFKTHLIFEETPKCEFEGSDCEERIARLSADVERDLYEENNMEAKTQAIRFLAAQELAQYPTLGSYKHLFKVAQYDGKWIDYDLMWECFRSLATMTNNLRAEIGEGPIALLLEELFLTYETRLGWFFIVDQLAEFETSAPLFFAIKFHTGSPTTKGNTAAKILEKVLKKDDFYQEVEKQKERIVKEILNPKQGNRDWEQERACDVFSASPQPGTVRTLIDITRKADSFGLESHCEDAVQAVLSKLDVKSEVVDLEPSMIEIVTEAPKPRNGWFGEHFSNGVFVRRIAVHVLMEIGSEPSKAALREAFKVKELEEDNRKAIDEFFKSIGEMP